MLISEYKQPITTIDMLYFQLQDPDSPFHGFEITVDKSEIRNNQYQIKVIGNDEREYFQQNIIWTERLLVDSGHCIDDETKRTKI